jgi:hypothetical protein
MFNPRQPLISANEKQITYRGVMIAKARVNECLVERTGAVLSRAAVSALCLFLCKYVE